MQSNHFSNASAPAVVPTSAKVQAQVTDEKRSALRRYQAVCVGSERLSYTLKYELLTGIGSLLPGAAGLVFRKLFYGGLFRRTGRGVVIGGRVTLRHPGRIVLGDRVVIGDGVVLDGRGESSESISLGDDTVVGENASVRCKGGTIQVGARVGIGSGATVAAVGTNHLSIGEDTMIGPCAYLSGVRYHTDRLDIPMSQQGHDLRGGISIGQGAWVGAGSMVLDGVTIGEGAIVAAGAVVTHDVPDYSIVAGVPAEFLRSRKGSKEPRRTA